MMGAHMNESRTVSTRRALVTGGRGAIGAAICRAFARSGIHVIMHANRRIDRAQCLAIEKILQEGPVQILVNNAGSLETKGKRTMLQLRLESIERVNRLHLKWLIVALQSMWLRLV